MDPINVTGFGFGIILVCAIAGIAILINWGTAKPGVIVILLLMPFLYLLLIGFSRGDIPDGLKNFSGAIIVAVISGIIVRLIVQSIRK